MLSFCKISPFHLTSFPLRLFTEIKFSKTHEWVKLDGDIATIGITNHAQKLLGEIVFVELPKNGTNIIKGGAISAIETVKTIATVYSPLPGVIIESNQKLLKNQRLLNTEPKKEGWIAKLKVTEEAKELFNSLLTRAQYNLIL